MTPAPSTRVVAPRRLSALRAGQRLAVVLHMHDHLALLQIQLHGCDSPGILNLQNPRVQVLVTHGSTVALLPLTPRPPAPSSTRNPEEPSAERRDFTNGPTRGTVFAIDRNARGQKVAYLRLFSGALRERQRVTFRRVERGGRITEFSGRITGLEVIGEHVPTSQARTRGADDQSPIVRDRPDRRLTAGNIGTLRGIPEVRVGDYLGDIDNVPLQRNFPPPGLATVVRALHSAQEARLHTALMSLANEDPLLQTRPAANGATRLLLYGSVQKEIVEARLRREYGIEPVFEQIQPAFFERPVGVGEAVREVDPRAQSVDFWATIGLRVEPTKLNGGVTFAREVKWGTVPPAFHRAIQSAALLTLQQGLYGWPVTDCSITLIRVAYIAPKSTAADFRNLTPLVLMQAMQLSGTRVYEPCHSLEIETPPDVIGAVIRYLTTLGAEIADSTSSGSSQLITAEIPTRFVQKFTASLRRLSRGEGVVWSRPGTDRPVQRPVPTHERFDGNPLNYEEYMRFLSQRRTRIVTTK